MGIKTFLRSSNKEKIAKIKKIITRNNWHKQFEPSLNTKIKTFIDVVKNREDRIIVNGFLLKFYRTDIQFMNWGDDINIYLFEKISNKKIIPYKTLLFARLFKHYTFIGSVIPGYVNNNTIICGSGILNLQSRIKTKPKKILAVRGPITRDYLLKNNIPCPEIYGDPALLLPLYYNKPKNKKYKISVIPHHRDAQDDLSILKLDNHIKEKGIDVHIIRMYQYKEWTDIIDEIRESELILSSSLHGLIVSDAYSIPNVFCEFIYHHPNYTKYEDYYMSINKNFNIPINYKDIKVNEIDNYINNYNVPNIDIEELRMLFISILKS